MTHAIGNSHSNFFTKSHPGSLSRSQYGSFVSHPIGPVIAYNFFEHHYPRVLEILESENLSSQDYVMLVVGEVDCRVHLPKQILLGGKNLENVVDECLDRFFRCYTDLTKRGYKVIHWTGHPSTNGPEDDNENSPVVGDVYFRNSISKLWDLYSINKCIENNIPYVSIIDALINSDGTTKMEHFIDYCHLNSDYLDNIINKFEPFL